DALENIPVYLVMNDMAPNMRGVRSADQAAAMYLCDLALDLATKVLRPGVDFLIKVFHGEGFDAYLRDVRSRFEKVQMRKPASSRDRSREQYLLARGMHALDEDV